MSLPGQAKLSPMLPELAEIIADALEGVAGEKVLFALHIFGEGNDKRGQYISNARRADVAKALTELLEHWKANHGKGRRPLPPRRAEGHALDGLSLLPREPSHSGGRNAETAQ